MRRERGHALKRSKLVRSRVLLFTCALVLPLGSLVPQKTCPVDGEKFIGTYKNCSFQGVELK